MDNDNLGGITRIMVVKRIENLPELSGGFLARDLYPDSLMVWTGAVRV